MSLKLDLQSEARLDIVSHLLTSVYKYSVSNTNSTKSTLFALMPPLKTQKQKLHLLRPNWAGFSKPYCIRPKAGVGRLQGASRDRRHLLRRVSGDLDRTTNYTIYTNMQTLLLKRSGQSAYIGLVIGKGWERMYQLSNQFQNLSSPISI